MEHFYRGACSEQAPANVRLPYLLVSPRKTNPRLSRYHGYGTVYSQDDLAGSCGDWHSDYDYICALSNEWMLGEYQGPECGRKIEVTNLGSDYGVGGTGNTIIVTVQDTCPTCDDHHVDFSVGAWNALTDGSPWGQLHIKWYVFGMFSPGRQ